MSGGAESQERPRASGETDNDEALARSLQDRALAALGTAPWN